MLSQARDVHGGVTNRVWQRTAARFQPERGLKAMPSRGRANIVHVNYALHTYSYELTSDAYMRHMRHMRHLVLLHSPQ